MLVHVQTMLLVHKKGTVDFLVMLYVGVVSSRPSKMPAHGRIGEGG